MVQALEGRWYNNISDCLLVQIVVGLRFSLHVIEVILG